MRATDLLSQLGRTVAYYPKMTKHFKSVTATVLFCQFFYWHDRAHSELGVFKTSDEITAETGLSYKEQLTARKQLVALGVLIETHKRLEHKIYYKINIDRVNELLESDIENSPYSQTAFGETTISNPDNDPNGSSLVSKITTEITRDINTSDKSLVVDNENIDRPDEYFVEETIPFTDKPKKLKTKIPYQAIVDIYHDVLPELSEVLVLNEKRKRYLSARWRENKIHQTLDFWKDYFSYVKKSQFLMGNSIPKNGAEPFRADFEWLINPNNFVKVIEGKYVRNI